ncbi:cation-translocating P-type ATPase [Nonomuraea cavernae]|uniref:Carbonate dehydratase n=1 Tax=Nonomuraea cavernae TaxID=2045107 RepID=A0A917ZBM7_9ACTN|nr:cation-translocating P-type ATPase [Nonomuraea cavernae]MCA2188838.1 cation-translocating P-type ATPase [Nonomuraea cavernae]GGO78397.1 carbonate dehydratase [Nonomuraea cavernae]
MDAITDVRRGLGDDEAARLLTEHGPNRIPEPRQPSIPLRAVRQLADPLSILLLVAGLVTLVVLGEAPEGAAIMAILAVNVVIGVTQEVKAERAVRALRTLSAPMAKVRRDGVVRRIAAAEVVPGDLIEVAAGDRVPADARVLEAVSLAVNESMLTGESNSAGKRAEGTTRGPLGDRDGQLFSGSMVVRGSGVAVVESTGAATEMGHIASALQGKVKGPLEVELATVSKRIGLLALAAGVVMVALGLARGGIEPLDLALAGVALAIAAVPESMAAAVTTALALGSQRMARRGVIVRRLPAIQALGATTVIASDKTGTLTTGRLTVADHVAVPGADVWRAAVRCNDAHDGVGDAVDVALLAAAARHGTTPLDGGARLSTRPFDADVRSMAVVTEGPVLTVKGAPEVVLARCAPGPEADRLERAVPELAGRGLRVLALAERDTDDLDATGLRPVALLALSDEIRESARQAVADCRRGGIRVIMVTGDHAGTARAVAEQVGIEPDPVVTGAALDGEDREERLREANVLARVDPATKLDLVRSLRAGGEVVAMTGDGVNDAPALRHADVGIAMAGDEGTDVAREAAAVVVTNGELGTIVTGVRQGRRLHHNVESMIGYLLAGNLAEIFLVLVGLFAWPDLVIPLLPVQLLWINLVLDGIPAIALGVDRPAGDPLTARPRRDGLLSGAVLARIGIRSLIVGLLVFAAVEVARRLGWDEAQVRTQAVLALVFARLTLAYVARARRWTFERGWWHGRAVLLAVAAAAALQALVTLVPALGTFLALAPVPPLGWAMAAGAALLTPVLCDAARALLRLGAGRARRERE